MKSGGEVSPLRALRYAHLLGYYRQNCIRRPKSVRPQVICLSGQAPSCLFSVSARRSVTTGHRYHGPSNGTPVREL